MIALLSDKLVHPSNENSYEDIVGRRRKYANKLHYSWTSNESKYLDLYSVCVIYKQRH